MPTAQEVVKRLGYQQTTVWRVESNRLVASSPRLGAFYLDFLFSPEEQTVLVEFTSGWEV